MYMTKEKIKLNFKPKPKRLRANVIPCLRLLSHSYTHCNFAEEFIIFTEKQQLSIDQSIFDVPMKVAASYFIFFHATIATAIITIIANTAAIISVEF